MCPLLPAYVLVPQNGAGPSLLLGIVVVGRWFPSLWGSQGCGSVVGPLACVPCGVVLYPHTVLAVLRFAVDSRVPPVFGSLCVGAPFARTTVGLAASFGALLLCRGLFRGLELRQQSLFPCHYYSCLLFDQQLGRVTAPSPSVWPAGCGSIRFASFLETAFGT